MGTFVSDPSTELFDDKEPAPGQALRAGWTTKNVLSADDANALKNAALDLRTAHVALATTVAGGSGSVGSATPQPVGAAAVVGVATTASRQDHVHAHGSQAGGSLHSVATGGAAGFMSAADKTKLDAVVGTNTGDITVDTANGLSLVGQALSLAAATTSTPGAMSAADKTALAAITTTPGASKVPQADGSGKISSAWLASDQAAGTASLRTLGTGSTQACAGNDARLTTPSAATTTPTGAGIPVADGTGKIAAGWLPSSVTGTDSRAQTTPAASKIPLANSSGIIDSTWLLANAAAEVASIRTLGTGSLEACPGNDSRLSTPSTATTSPAAGGIPIAGGDGKLDVGWIPSVDDSRATNIPTAFSIPFSDVAGKIHSGWLASDQAAGTVSLRSLGTSSTQAAAGNDSRFATPSNATATPTASKIPIADGSAKLDGWITSAAAAGTASLRTLGTGATDACAGNDSRLISVVTSSVSAVTAALPASLNLSTEGAIDWFHINTLTTFPMPLVATANYRRKMRGEADMFHSFVWVPSVGAGVTLTNGDLDFPCSTTNTDCVSRTALSVYENGTYVFPAGTQVGHGFRFRVRATRETRYLRIYCGRNVCDATAYFSLSDGTSQTLSVPKAAGTPTVFQLGQMITVTFNAANWGQWLYCEFLASTSYGSGSTINFHCATLASS